MLSYGSTGFGKRPIEDDSEQPRTAATHGVLTSGMGTLEISHIAPPPKTHIAPFESSLCRCHRPTQLGAWAARNFAPMGPSSVAPLDISALRFESCGLQWGSTLEFIRVYLFGVLLVSLRPLVLCIDDNVLVLAIRKSLLESRDFRVLTAEDGPAGLEIVNRKPVDVVIIDYEMPGMDGGAVAKELRRRQPNLPILLVSGFTGKIPESLLAIVDGFIAKGSSPDLLINEVVRVTEAETKQPEPAQPFEVSKKHIRPSHKRVGPSKRQRHSSKHKLQRCRRYRNR